MGGIKLINLKNKPFYLSDEDITWVKGKLAEMDIKAKVGQLFCPIGASADKEILKNILTEIKPGAIMYRPNSESIIRETHHYIQETAEIPLLIAANLESGGTGIVSEGTLFGTQMQVAATSDTQSAYKLGLVSGREGNAVGINWTFSPVVDIDINFRNPITNTRTYGSDPETVAEMSKAFMKGIHECGMAVSVKHFPGDGVDERDQHLLTSVNTLSTEEWDKTYGMIYKEMIDNGAQSVMIGHIMLPSYQRELNPDIKDEDMMPASLSPELLKKLLREKLGFNGLIVTDATTMTGFTMAMKREDAVPFSIQAGCDMFLFNIGLKSDYEYMLKGIDRGILTVERLDEAVTRILALKASLNLHKKKEQNTLVPSEDKLKELDDNKHKEWAKDCADKAITLVKDTQKLLPLSPSKHKRVLMYVLGDVNMAGAHLDGASKSLHLKKLMEDKGFEVEIFDMNTFDAKNLQKSPIEQTSKYDLVMYFANLGVVSNQTAIRINWIAPYGTITPKFIQEVPTMFISVSSPYHLQDVPRIKTMVNAYTSSEVVIESLLEKLVGNSAFKGKNPVDPFCGLWDTRL